MRYVKRFLAWLLAQLEPRFSPGEYDRGDDLDDSSDSRKVPPTMATIHEILPGWFILTIDGDHHGDFPSFAKACSRALSLGWRVPAGE